MKISRSILSIAIFVFVVGSSYSQNKVATNAEDVALNGYDVVAYFKQHQAVRGNNANAVKKDGATYYFSSAENASAFKSNPKMFQPVYGGYCAFAMAMKGAKVPADPNTFKLRDGKLYLFFNDYYEGKPFNTIVPWNSNEKEMIAKADQNWKGQK
ncbi:YHS domain-containing (seleno)protein [Flagellimonas sp. S3867]|uniref:YHS domain-containing (seleno)protein n=1 Tax=Flagellimonas sp. S3867 TaxID=2768063 RepID=UPI00168252C8|nr:YHS domain-containing (seleno)protein [Flagellimonas sp. S3867]